MRVLITSGATREPIDSVRFISNISTGKMGALIADYLAQQGIDVTLVCGQGSERPKAEVNTTEYASFRDLDNTLRQKLGSSRYDAVIHAAAVSDFSVLNPHAGKMTSEQDELTITLSRNFKIVERLKDYSMNPDQIQIIAFKLTHTSDRIEQERAIHKLSFHPKINFVVHNDLAEIMQVGRHPFSIYSRDQKMAEGKTKQDLAETLLKMFKQTKTERLES